MKQYLSIAEAAERAGLSRNTVKAYVKVPGRFPKPDVKIGRVQGWSPATIDAWAKAREQKRS